MKLLSIVVAIISASFSALSRAEYPVSMLRSGRLPDIASPAYFTRNDTIYFYGGSDRGDKTLSRFGALSFDKYGDIDYNTIITKNEPSLAYNYRAVFLPDSDTAMLFGGVYSRYNGTNGTVPLIAYRYSFKDETWMHPQGTQPGTNTSTIPQNRLWHTVTMASNGLLYIFGGELDLYYASSLPILSDLWSYDVNSGAYSKLATAPMGLYGHTATALPDGRIIYVGGFTNNSAKTAQVQANGLEISTIYFTNNDTWMSQELNTGAFKTRQIPRGDMENILGPEGRYIYYFGGHDKNETSILNFFNDLYILDTKTFTWIDLDVPGAKPTMRTGGISGLISNEYCVFAFGTTGNYKHNTVDVLKLPEVNETTGELIPGSAKWIANTTTGEALGETTVDPPVLLSRGATVAIACSISIAAAVVCIYLLWRCLQHRNPCFLKQIRFIIWNPRAGEPSWVEASRLVSKIILLLLFIAFLVLIILQVLESPVATYITRESAPENGLEIPDIRVCFEGFGIEHVSPSEQNMSYPFVGCQTGVGESCVNNLKKLDFEKHKPWFIGNLGNTTCYLFRANNEMLDNSDGFPVTLGSSTMAGVNNGSEIRLEFIVSPFIDLDTKGLIHLSFYPSRRDPNRKLYWDETNPSLSENDINAWLADDSNDFQDSGTIVDIESDQTSYVEYQLERTENLKNTSWNYVGFSPEYNTIHQVSITARTQTRDRFGGNDRYAKAIITPASFVTVVHREQKIYSLVNAVGLVGGLFGLFITFQSIMFGYRPQSPFGIIHSWSFGPMRRSIYQSLREEFDVNKKPVPLVSPVLPGYTTKAKHRRPVGIENSGDSRDIDMNANIYSYLSSPTGKVTQKLPLFRRSGDSFAEDSHGSLEDRVQLLELLFQSYYVNDEVFRTLDTAHRQSEEVASSNSMTRCINGDQRFRRFSQDCRPFGTKKR